MKINAALAVSVLVAASVSAEGQPSIQFTYVPPTGDQYSYVSGKVTGASPSTYGVALFINVFGTYWTKPTYLRPITPLASDGTFSANITTGGTGSLDAYAEQVIAFVVPLSYDIPTLGGESFIPQEIYDHSVASVTANKFTPISFANNWWEVKDTGNGTWGPGPNFFTGSSVSVDGQGRLHLKIAYVNGAWCCSEVILTNSLGYGSYRIWLDDDLSSLPPNIVFGFFTWNDAPSIYADTYREIDVEFSNGAVAGAPTNWQYVIQPYYTAGNRTNFSAPSVGMSNSTHAIMWIPGAAYFESYTNHAVDARTFNILSSADPSGSSGWSVVGSTNVVAGSTNTITIVGPEQSSRFYRAAMTSFAGSPAPFKEVWLTNGIPPAGGESLHMNLWLDGGAEPSSDTSATYEVIVSKFEFIPLISLEPKLGMVSVGTNQTKLSIRYRAN